TARRWWRDSRTRRGTCGSSSRARTPASCSCTWRTRAAERGARPRVASTAARPGGAAVLRQRRQAERHLQLELAIGHAVAEELLGAPDSVGDGVLVHAEPARRAREARSLLEEHRERARHAARLLARLRERAEAAEREAAGLVHVLGEQ